jgi:hypothetical protein
VQLLIINVDNNFLSQEEPGHKGKEWGGNVSYCRFLSECYNPLNFRQSGIYPSG